MEAGSVDQSAIRNALERIRAEIAGEVRTDRLARAMYATDASIYEIVPDGVVFPKSVDDVVAAVRACAEFRTPLTPRGAGTGLTGACVNSGIQLDCSRHLNRILEIDPNARTATIEPGVVLDQLNAEAAGHGLHFAPDVATASRATLGGMIANNSCGAHSVVYGRTVDHVLSVDVVLSDGSKATWGAGRAAPENELARRCDAALTGVSKEYGAEVDARFPKVMRRNGGYALDRLRIDHGRANAESVICGSEGTLCVITGATLKLTPIVRHKGMVIAHFADLFAAMAATPTVLEHGPAAVELIDKHILDAAEANPILLKRCGFITGDPKAILICELLDEDGDRLTARLKRLADELEKKGRGYAWPILTDAPRQADVWAMRKAGLGLLMSQPGESQPYAFVEDTAVDPARLSEYMTRFDEILTSEGVKQAGYYAHASVGCLHVRPVLNLRKGADVQRMQRIMDRVSSLALEYGGTITGEHGDGIVRSSWLEKMYGPRIVEAFRRVKSAFDPHNILNPGKIVDPLPMTSNLRYGADFEAKNYATILDFSVHGGMAGLASMCSGVGQCRQTLVGTMCPSYMATGDETHTTRARANALRLALSNRGLLDGLADPALREVFDLCISCKACQTECPTGVDMAKLKAEWLAYMHRREGVPKRSRLIAAAVDWAPWGSRFAPLSNWIMQSGAVRAVLERRYGLDRRVPPPLFVRRTFRAWFRKHEKAGRDRMRDHVPDAPGDAKPDAEASVDRTVVYFVDTWTNHYAPQVGRATIKVLEALGYKVIVPPTACCGRPLISKGMLAEAKILAERNVEALGRYAARGLPIVGTEPSCVSVLTDELPQLVRNNQARRIADSSMMIESFVARELENRPGSLQFDTDRIKRILYHGHCHQKALYGTDDAMCLLKACTGGHAGEVNSGCCGMAGSFGHEVEHYEVAKAIGEQRLFPAVRGRGDAEIAVSGFSCRHQLAHHTGVEAKHVIELVAEALQRK